MHVMQFKHPGRFSGQDVWVEDWSDEEDENAERTIEQAEEDEQQAGNAQPGQEAPEA